jgi:ribonuclease HI
MAGFTTFDIYTDASINVQKKLGCAGYVMVNRKRDQTIDQQFYCLRDTTNNESEVAAIAMGVNAAINLLYTEELPFLINLFSDSMISLCGVRDWIPQWIARRKGDTLYGSGGIVQNQEWFKYIYAQIIQSGIRIKFFHQKGHVNLDSPKSLYDARRVFTATNSVSMNKALVDPIMVSKYNGLVDNMSRDCISSGELRNVSYYPTEVIEYRCDPNQLATYQNLINGGLNYPHKYA